MGEVFDFRWLRFSLRAALLAILVWALLLAAYRRGFEDGRKRGLVAPTSFTAHTLYTRDYDISDIAKSQSDAEMLIRSVRATAEPSSWADTGGAAEITLNVSAMVLTVSHVNGGHASVVQYLTLVRDLATKDSDLAIVLGDAEAVYSTGVYAERGD